jgi:hypothetical protein
METNVENNFILALMKDRKVSELTPTQIKSLVKFVSGCTESEIIDYIKHILDNEYTAPNYFELEYDIPSTGSNKIIEDFLYGSWKIKRCFKKYKKEIFK